MDISIDISNITLETDRLLLRPWQEEDLNDFYKYASVEGVGEMAGWKHHESIEVSKQMLQSFISGRHVFAIVYKENNKVIGSLGLHKSWADDDSNYANLKVKEIGYVLSKDYWGQGLMAEAVKEVIRFCFEDYKLDALTVGHFSFNNQSRRVIEKCGFKFVKNSEFYAKHLGETYEDKKYILFNKDEEVTFKK